ncbi:MAG: hypothetical protein DRI84_09220 [Bacteroidetes bacterium]|nr:MAG: hypothetical protein DRI84_09220 [Bacteroidota bacterium]
MSKTKGLSKDDWRRQGQEKYLNNIILIAQNYHSFRDKLEHDHCEFCGKKFSNQKDDLKMGYSTVDGYHWICIDCFNDFSIEFNWEIISNPDHNFPQLD